MEFRIPYSKAEKLESAAYREVELSDIIVSIVGGRFGSESADHPGLSISQAELRHALDRGIQVFVFVEKSTLSEYFTYLLNKSTPGVKYRFADDVRVHEFIEQLYALPQNTRYRASRLRPTSRSSFAFNGQVSFIAFFKTNDTSPR